MKTARASIIGLSLIAALGLCSQMAKAKDGVPGTCGPHTTDTKCIPAAEPSVVPELILCLSATAGGVLLWRWNRKSLKPNPLPR